MTTTATTTARPISAFEQVLSQIPAEDQSWVGLDAMRYWNCCGGRPSDAARSSVAAYKSGRLTKESFDAERERERQMR